MHFKSNFCLARYVILGILITLLAGCATNQKLATESAKISLAKRIAIVPNQSIPKASLDTFAKGRWVGAGKGLLIGFGLLAGGPLAGSVVGAAVAGPGGSMSGAFLGAAAAALYFPLSPIVGAIKAIPAEEAKKIDESVPRLFINLNVQETFTQHVMQARQSMLADYDFELVNAIPTPLTDSGYDNLKNQGFDAALEISIDEIGFAGGEGSHPSIALFLNGHYRLVDLSNKSELYSADLSYKGSEHAFDEWTANDAQLVKSEFDHCYHTFSSEILEKPFVLVDSNLLIWNASQYCMLKPEYPPFEVNFAYIPAVVEVDSLRPTLRWQAFPRSSDQEYFFNQINNISYDLKIWHADLNQLGELVYSKEGIITPFHTLESDLKLSARYYWTVRARFNLGKKKRLTQWSHSRWPRAVGCADQNILAEDYFQFKTR
jgi:hypothetical protein